MIDEQGLTTPERQRLRHREFSKRYAKAHRKEVNAYRRRRYHQQHKDVNAHPGRPRISDEAKKLNRAMYHALRYQTHRSEMMAYNRNYYLTHRDQLIEYAHNYRARRDEAVGTFTWQEFFEKCTAQDWKCTYCGLEKPLTVDHMIPLSKGGSNSIDNITPACLTCNCSKGDKTYDEYIDRIKSVNKLIIEE